jgi:hypothetical protein
MRKTTLEVERFGLTILVYVEFDGIHPLRAKDAAGVPIELTHEETIRAVDQAMEEATV